MSNYVALRGKLQLISAAKASSVKRGASQGNSPSSLTSTQAPQEELTGTKDDVNENDSYWQMDRSLGRFGDKIVDYSSRQTTTPPTPKSMLSGPTTLSIQVASENRTK